MPDNLSASLIISAYKDARNLECILACLARQTRQGFEIIVSEDGCSGEIRATLQHASLESLFIQHLTQEDQGFRKNRALNRAVLAARTEHLIFIDGDCAPPNTFIQAHIESAEANAICAGRRVELGPGWSEKLRKEPALIDRLSTNYGYTLAGPSIWSDSSKNYESGFRSKLLQRLHPKKKLNLVGCNFSCNKAALERINGFDESYEAPGLGEDTDVQWRLEAQGYRMKNIKFLAPLFHLHHPRTYGYSRKNEQIFLSTRASGRSVCEKGLLDKRAKLITPVETRDSK